MKKIFLVLLIFVFSSEAFAEEVSEVFSPTHAEVLIRQHPKTGEEYVSIIPNDGIVPEDPIGEGAGKYSRPDYRMLDNRFKKGEVSYDGPYSSRKKVYVFAASMATLGATGAVVGATVFPVAAGTAATGSALGPGIGAAVTGAGFAAAAVNAKGKNIPDDYQRLQSSELLEHENDFFRMYIKKTE